MTLERVQVESILKRMGFVESMKKDYVFWKKYPEGIAFVLFKRREGWSSMHSLEFEYNERDIHTDVQLLLKPDNYDQDFGFKVKDEYDYWKWRLLGSRCEVCGEKIEGEPINKRYHGFLCSEKCLIKLEIENRQRCKICGKPIKWFDKENPKIEHHLSYKDDKTISICRSCHARVHFSKDSLDHKLFKPIDERLTNK